MPRIAALLCLCLAAAPSCHRGRAPSAAHSTALPHWLHGLASRGRLPADDTLDLRIHVAPDEVGLDRYLKDSLGKPVDPLTPDQFAERFGPHHDALAAVRLHLQEHGIEVTGVHGSFIAAKAKVEQAEKAFGAELHHLGDDDRGTVGYGPLTAIHPPGNLPIVAVHGLATGAKRRPRLAQAAHHAAYYSGAQMRQACNMPPNVWGRGQSVGILELDGYVPGDVYAYANNMGIRQPHLTNILLDGADGTVQNSGSQVEVTMDIELVAAMAPGLDDLRVYIAPNSGRSWMDLLNEMANPTVGDRLLMPIISISWGAPELESGTDQLRSESLIFKQMAAQGQTVFVASGDSGARDDGSDLGVDDPASQPYALGVGGTHLVTDPNGNFYWESAWSSGGGGNSAVWAAPSWQASAANNDGLSLGQVGHRMVPDISADADPETGHLLYIAGGWTIVGGTSAAAPLWAGLYAGVRAHRVSLGKKPLGFFAPYLYAAGSAGGMHDVYSGSNGYYPAVRGYDLATGWGSIDGNSVINYFSALP